MGDLRHPRLRRLDIVVLMVGGGGEKNNGSDGDSSGVAENETAGLDTTVEAQEQNRVNWEFCYPIGPHPDLARLYPF